MRRRTRSAGLRWLAGIAVAAMAAVAVVTPPAAMADVAADTGAEAPVAVTRGITGSVRVVDASGLGLQPRADLNLDSPFLVRIAGVESAGPDARGTVYTLEFIGTVEGSFDLRDGLERPGGARPSELAPVRIEIVRRLEAGAGTDVTSVAIPVPRLRGGYRGAIIALGVVWVLVPIGAVVGRMVARRRRPAPPPAEPAPTLAERLEPLVLAAAERTMSVEERGRLELLLIAHLDARASAGLPEPDRAAAIARLRRDPGAGPLLTAVESWLHRPGDPGDRRARVTDLLAPFRPGAPSSEPAP